MEITIGHITSILTTALKQNAPVRSKPLGAIKNSPYPGNLKNNGIVDDVSDNSSQVVIGGTRAPYAEYTEYTSFKPGWMAKSNQELVDKLRQAGGRVR